MSWVKEYEQTKTTRKFADDEDDFLLTLVENGLGWW